MDVRGILDETEHQQSTGDLKLISKIFPISRYCISRDGFKDTQHVK